MVDNITHTNIILHQSNSKYQYRALTGDSTKNRVIIIYIASIIKSINCTNKRRSIVLLKGMQAFTEAKKLVNKIGFSEIRGRVCPLDPPLS